MENTCTTVGDGDLYGLGVRLGLYLQWLAGFLLRNVDGSWKTISSVRTANNAVSSALNLTVIINTVRGDGLSLNYPIVYYLTVALFYAESYNLMRKDNSEKKGYKYKLQPDAALVIQNVIFASTTLFGSWFWLHGVFKSRQPSCGEPKLALIGLFDLQDDRWRRFATSLSIIAGLVLALVLCLHAKLFMTISDLRQPVTREALLVLKVLGPISGPTPHEVYAVDTPGLMARLLRPHLMWRRSPKLLFSSFHWFIMNLAGPLIAIVSVERTLLANKVSTGSILESSGQMISLISGIMSLCMAVWDIYRSFFMEASDVDLLSSHLYESHKPLNKDQIKRALDRLSAALEDYDRGSGIDDSM